MSSLRDLPGGDGLNVRAEPEDLCELAHSPRHSREPLFHYEEILVIKS